MIPSFIKSIKSRVKNRDVSLLLHIGMPKTGSTALQRILAHNREQLRQQQKTLYPECGVPAYQHAALVKSIVMPLFDWVNFNKHIDLFEPADYINYVLKQCRDKRCQKVILSSEYFWASPAMQSGDIYHRPDDENFAYIREVVKACRKLFSVFSKTTVAVYLRRQDDWIDSFFNQQIKDGFSIPTQEELLCEAKNYLLYQKNLDIWAEAFGRENLVVRH